MLKVVEVEDEIKKIAEKARKSGRHIWAIWGNFGPFWIILGHSRAMLDHLGPFGVIFGPLWVILGHFWAILWHFRTNLRKVQFFLRDR